MPDFKRNNRFKSGGPGPRGGDRSFRDQNRESYTAECNACHKQCEVPFRPNGRKPVYCSDCFKKEERPSHSDRYEKRPFTRHEPAREQQAPDRRIDDIQRQLASMNETLGRVLAALESSNRAAALSKEVRKHIPAAKPAPAPAKKPARAAVKKVAKRVVKKTAKK